MYARKNKNGSPIMPYHEYPIAADTAVERGQAVKLVNGLVVAATAADTSELLGVAAESHDGTEDALNERSNGKKILVYDADDTLFACPAPVVTAAAGGSATTLIAAELATFANDDFKGGYVKLVSKAEGSLNADSVGQVREITGSTASSKTFTLEEGGTPAEGDVYAVFPPIGFAKGNFDATITKLTLSATAAIKMKVAGHETDAGNILLQRT